MPELAYRIVEWKRRYEVTYRGHEANDDTPIEDLRRRPLEFYRSKVRGHNKGRSYLRMKRKAKQFGLGMGSATFGIFHDLCELASNQQAQYRGWILCEKQKPMTIEDIAEYIDEDEDVVKRAMEILCDPKIGWVQQVEYQIIPEISGNPEKFRVPSEDEAETKDEEEVKDEDETKRVRFPEKPETVSVRTSISRGSDFGSVSIQSARLKATDALERIFPTRTPADDTTIRHILEQVPQDRFSDLLKAAEESTRGNTPIAMFVHRAKRLGFRGNGGP